MRACVRATAGVFLVQPAFLAPPAKLSREPVWFRLVFRSWEEAGGISKGAGRIRHIRDEPIGRDQKRDGNEVGGARTRAALAG